ncbi:kinase-like domain-containing protein [Rhizophagus clarus]|uniref:Kinase-like domain-containing protein n=1 Tax=Rhizophagus clarus TaxID=94130 RepID=A0A8H3M325_9GLOM|nr:kinase-like domain-containing protein [Rhizophagus clarus]
MEVFEYHDVSHDKNLAIKICQGFRPKFNNKVPQIIIHLIKRCLDTNPLNRPTIDEFSLSYETHSEAIYTISLLNFNDLPEPKNSDDYYKQYNNITSEEYSGN